jgi:3,4-dihydroxy-2-butanone 4-phosphate synthase
MMARSQPDPSALREALADAGIACEVAIDGRLALLRAARGTTVDWPRLADLTVELARAAGFTHAAVELTPDDAASLHRD